MTKLETAYLAGGCFWCITPTFKEMDGVTDVVSGTVKEYSLDVPAQIVDGRTLIPLRAVSQALGKNVAWDGSTSTALISD